MIDTPLLPKEPMLERDLLDTRLLDELADGQWHPIGKIRANLNKLSAKTPITPKPTKETLLVRLDQMVEDGTLRAGNNSSYRFKTSNLETWRVISETLDLNDKRHQPRYFGRVLEDDGWEQAPLKTYDLVHFRVNGDLSKREVMDLTEEPAHLVIIEDGLYRVFTTRGDEVYQLISDAKQSRPEWGVSGIRLERNLKRRDLDDLPRGFLNDLCRYYGEFTKVLLRSKMSSIHKHISETDDIQQQIYVWVIDAVQRYDATTSIPFGAYLGKSLENWVFNLNRKAFGRSVADMELKHARAVAKFMTDFERIPSDEELAVLLETTVENVRRDAQLISTVVALRNQGALYTQEDTELPVPSDEFVEDNLEAMVEKTLLSSAITRAASMVGGASVQGLIGVYYENWGKDHRSKRISAWLNTDGTRRAVGKVLGRAREIMERVD